jgi:hypothetical protein
MFPDPYATSPGKPGFREWCESEGRLHFPAYFPRKGEAAVALPVALVRTRVSAGSVLRMLLTMLAPVRGRWLRFRLVEILKTEGFTGISRRLRGQPPQDRPARERT